MDLQTKYLDPRIIKNLEKKLLDVDGPFRRVLLESRDFFYFGIETDIGNGLKRINAIPYPIDPTSPEFFGDASRLPVIRLPSDPLLSVTYRLDDNGNVIPAGPEGEVFADMHDGADY